MKQSLLTNPAQVIQVASAEHDGIITKEKFAEIGITKITTKNYGFTFDVSSIPKIHIPALIATNDISAPYPTDPVIGLEMDVNNNLFKTSTFNGERGSKENMYYIATPVTIENISFTLFLSAYYRTPSPNYLFIYLRNGNDTVVLSAGNETTITANPSKDVQIKSVTYKAFTVTLNGTNTGRKYIGNKKQSIAEQDMSIIGAFYNSDNVVSIISTDTISYLDFPPSSIYFASGEAPSL